MRVSNADVHVSSMQLRSPTMSAYIRDHGAHFYVQGLWRIVTSNSLETRVLDAVNHAGKPIMNDDDTTGTMQK
jgi:hypothetical protein